MIMGNHMKGILCIGLLLTVASAAFGQGTIGFANGPMSKVIYMSIGNTDVYVPTTPRPHQLWSLLGDVVG